MIYPAISVLTSICLLATVFWCQRTFDSLQTQIKILVDRCDTLGRIIDKTTDQVQPYGDVFAAALRLYQARYASPRRVVDEIKAHSDLDRTIEASLHCRGSGTLEE